MDPASLQPSTVIIPLVKGLDLKTDEQVMQPPELLRLDNASFFAPGAIQKDPGYAALSTTVLSGSAAVNSPIRRLIDAGTSQLIADRDGILERVEGADRLHRLPGSNTSTAPGFNPFGSIGLTRIDDVALNSTATAACQYAAVANGSNLYSLFMAGDTLGSTGLSIIIREDATGAILFTSLQQGHGQSLCCCTTGTKVAAFWLDGANLKGLFWDASTPTTAPSVNLAIAVDASGTALDAVAGASNFYLSYINTAPGLIMRKVGATSALASVATGTLAGAGMLTCSIAIDSSENTLVVYRDGGGAKMAGFTSAAANRNNSTIDAAATGSIVAISNENSTGKGAVFYRKSVNDTVHAEVSFDGAGGAIATATLFDTARISKPWRIDAQIYLAYSYAKADANGFTERVCFVAAHSALSLALTPAEPVSWFLYARPVLGTNDIGAQVASVTGAFWSEYRFAVGVNGSTSAGDSDLSVSLQRFYAWEGQAIAIPNKAAGAMIANNYATSGAGLIETSLGNAPVITAIVNSAVVGALVSGQTYTWQAVYEITMLDGTVIRSPASLPVSFQVSGGNTSAQLTVSFPFTRSGLTIQTRLFRSQAGPGATRTLLTIASSNTRRAAGSASFVDSASDASIASNRLVYTTGGVLDAQPAPPHRAIAIHQNRLFAIVEETREIRYTRDIVDGESPAWHANLTVNAVGQGIVPYALISTANGLWVMGRDIRSGGGAIALLVGDGPDDTGASSTYNLQRLETADTGPADWRHAVSTPNGIVYEDPWRGYHLLPPGGGTPQFIGAPIEANRLQNGAIGGSTALTLTLKRNELRICNVDRIFVWHYDVNAWSQRLLAGSPTIGDAGMWSGNHVLRTSAGILRQGTTFQDNGAFYALAIGTGWIRMADIAGLQKVWEIYLCGKFKSAHGLTVNLYYDGSSTPDTYTFSTADETANSADLKLRIKPRVRKMERLKVEIIDTDAGSGTREGVQWNAIRIHYGALRKGTKTRTTALKG